MLLSTPTPTRPSLRIAVVGDCYSQWDERDLEALDAINPDLALFVGNYADEDVDTVGLISKAVVSRPSASIFGNRDFLWMARKWRGHHPLSWYRNHGASMLQQDVRSRPQFREESLEKMHIMLENSDVGYRVRDFSSLGLSVVGARPFTNGGRRRGGARRLYKSKFYRFHWGVRTLEDSSQRIVDSARAARYGHSTLVLAHHGPHGLGDSPSDPCGCDWTAPNSPQDWGDPDLESALKDAQAMPGVRVPLVVFGHMPSTLQGGGARTMAVRRGATTFVNAAVHPRWRGVRPGKASRGIDTETVERAFTLIDLGLEPDLDAGVDEPTAGAGDDVRERAVPWTVTRVKQVWLLPTGDVCDEQRLL